ncbi:hypothetical protein GCM10027570_38360 [Streptomonospora sediminis]
MTSDAPSCYLLEFSVGSGGARLGDVHAAPDLAAARESFETRFAVDPDSYLLMWYGAVLHLWVVRCGAVTEGIDLHPYLRSGTPAGDRTLARVVTLKRKAFAADSSERDWEVWEDADLVMETADFDCAPTLPVLGRVLELHDRIDADPGSADAQRAAEELEGFRESDGELPDGWPALDAGPRALRLDWDALACVVPALEAPLLTSGWIRLAWAGEPIRVKDSQITEGLRWDPSFALHVGWNDLENGEDGWLGTD